MNRAAPPLRSSRTLLIMAAVAALLLVLALAYRVGLSGSRSVIFDGESDFGRVRVVERADGLRSLYTGDGRARQSAIYPGRPAHLELAYTRVATVGLALAPEDGRILYVGLGGGAMPMYARVTLPDARIEVVEIDPLIVSVAREYFGFRPDSLLVVHTGDGRTFIENTRPGTYDLVVLDAFSDDEIPSALTTLEFLDAVRRSLAPDGVVVSNLWSSQGEYAPMLATYHAVFDQVHLVRVGHTSQRILVAGSDARRLDRSALVAASSALARRVKLGFDLPALVERGYEASRIPDAPVLRDRVPAPSARARSARSTSSCSVAFAAGWITPAVPAHRSRGPAGGGGASARAANAAGARPNAGNHGGRGIREALAWIGRVQAGESVSFEYRIRRPDGQIRWLRNTDFRFRDEAGHIRHLGGIGQDVTERERTDEALRGLNETLEQRGWAEAARAEALHQLAG